MQVETTDLWQQLVHVILDFIKPLGNHAASDLQTDKTGELRCDAQHDIDE